MTGERGIVFRIPPELLAMLPKREDCTPAAVAEAMRFLTDEWLVDVAADYAGKCILIAAALTIIERSLLPDRPAFWVTAGRRGGGKTTALIMLLMAATGMRPSAAAWSPNEEERRKALLSYLLAAVPAIVWDNIPRGTQISCPHIEKSCTTALYSDRTARRQRDGGRRRRRHPLLHRQQYRAAAATCLAKPPGRGSKSIAPTPKTGHSSTPIRSAGPKPTAAKILAALYTILLGNPVLRPGSTPRPRDTLQDLVAPRRLRRRTRRRATRYAHRR